jgi:hypothetical protein
MAEKACLACLRAGPKPEFRQARQQREAQRPESFKRRAFSFGSSLFGGTKRKEHDRTKSGFLLYPVHTFYFS